MSGSRTARCGTSAPISPSADSPSAVGSRCTPLTVPPRRPHPRLTGVAVTSVRGRRGRNPARGAGRPGRSGETVRQPAGYSPLLVHGILCDPRTVLRRLVRWWQPPSLRGHGHGRTDADGDPGFGGWRAGWLVCLRAAVAVRRRHQWSKQGHGQSGPRRGRECLASAVPFRPGRAPRPGDHVRPRARAVELARREARSPSKAGRSRRRFGSPPMPSSAARRSSMTWGFAASTNQVRSGRSCDSSSAGSERV